MAALALAAPVRAAWAPPASDELLGALARQGQAPQSLRFSRTRTTPERSPLPPDRITPLGSVWKMFAYFYLSETGRELPPYSCRGKSAEEVFCCKPGGSIGMEEALAKSCGLFFSPKRLGLGPGEWGRFWKERMGLPYPWLADLDRLSNAEAPVSELLGALQAIRARGPAFDRLYAALAGVLVEGTARASVGKLGSSFRVKTFTLADPAEPGGFVGGFAGWLPDGSAV
ncbi:MAG: DUF2300 domain-containing protein, partial [Elusimicrobiota bacterium]